jgi:hypothetical protein
MLVDDWQQVGSGELKTGLENVRPSLVQTMRVATKADFGPQASEHRRKVYNPRFGEERKEERCRFIVGW